MIERRQVERWLGPEMEDLVPETGDELLWNPAR
jgi:hypothetical protein